MLTRKNKRNGTSHPLPSRPAPPRNGKQPWEGFWDIDPEHVKHLPAGAHYELILDQFFQASHYVVMEGKTGPLHTHSYRLEVRCRSNSLLPDNHVVLGYRTLRERIKKIVQVYNHTLLNDLPPFKTLQPTTEALLGVIAQQIQRLLADLPVEPVSLTLWESPDEGMRYHFPPTESTPRSHQKVTLRFNVEET